MKSIYLRAITTAALSTLLAACGGGGSSSGSTSASTANTSSGATTTGSSTQTATDYAFAGSAPTVTGVNGSVAAVFSANALTHNSITGTAFFTSGSPLSGFVQQSAYGGAFTAVTSGAGAITLTKGSTIADIAGAGGYVAIGRWTSGSDTSGGNYTANQGGVYAVGNPLTLTAGTGTLACSAVMSTSPTSVSGNVALGSLVSASATLDMTTLALTNFSATVTIGSDHNATFSKASVPARGEAIGGGLATMSETVGNNVATPLIAMAYGVSLPNTGDINGLVVLSCH